MSNFNFSSIEQSIGDPLYNNLKKLVETNDGFYVSIHTDKEYEYEIFLYRLASYTDFQEPDAIESRGIMFNEGVCVCRPMEKFWNLHECSQWPEHTNTNWDEYTECEVKEDGSLISTWRDRENLLRCKSKGSLFSVQAIMAQDYLNNNKEFFECLDFFSQNLYTINLELVSPDNRIVLAYPETKLVILNIRKIKTGKYLPRDEAIFHCAEIEKYWVEFVEDIKMEDVPAMSGTNGEVIEGFIYRHPITGHTVKCKTDRYVEIHHAKDDVNNPKRLLQCVLEEGSDDLRSLFENDKLTIKYIDEFEQEVFDKYNSMVMIVEDYFNSNKHLTQKEFAVNAQNRKTIINIYFSLAMSAFNGKHIKYKEFMIKNRKSLFPEINWVVE